MSRDQVGERTEKEIAQQAVSFYQSLLTMADWEDGLSDETKAELMEDFIEEELRRVIKMIK